MTERNEEEENHDEDEKKKKNNEAFSSSFLSRLNLPEHILSDRVVRRTQARLIARKETVADAEADEIGLNEIAMKRITRGKTIKTKEKEKKECSRCENERNLISSLKRDLSQANAKSRRLSKMVSTRDEAIEDLKKRGGNIKSRKSEVTLRRSHKSDRNRHEGSRTERAGESFGDSERVGRCRRGGP